jgi:hypothetical protein
MHHSHHTVSNAASGKERRAEMTDSKPIEDRDENEQEEWHERTRNQILMFAVGIVLFGLVLGLILDWYIDPQTSTQKKDLVQALGLITAGVAGAVVIFFTWRGQERNQRNTQEQFRLTRQSQEQNQKSTQAQLENAQEELRLTRQGQITERFTRAIDQLGSEKLEIRLGGIYALERIDKESPERAYHGTVMEVLTAYVRENSRQDHEKPSTPTSGSDEDAEQDKGVEQDKAPPVRKPPTDLQAILDVLKRRAVDRVPWQHRVHLDLREAFLQGANLQGANLQGADLEAADLQRTDHITQDQIESTIGSSETKLPEGLNHPELWSKSPGEQMDILQERINEEQMNVLLGRLSRAEESDPVC